MVDISRLNIAIDFLDYQPHRILTPNQSALHSSCSPPHQHLDDFLSEWLSCFVAEHSRGIVKLTKSRPAL